MQDQDDGGEDLVEEVSEGSFTGRGGPGEAYHEDRIAGVGSWLHVPSGSIRRSCRTRKEGPSQDGSSSWSLMVGGSAHLVPCHLL